jgi:nitric oxide dioxygenase
MRLSLLNVSRLSASRASSFSASRLRSFPCLPASQAMRTKSTFSLSPEHVKVLEATVPAVAAANTDFTKHFYKRLFVAVPCLQNVFNNTNQAKGDQQERLFSSVAEAAVSVLENRSVDMELVHAICHKHCALGVQPGQYGVVGGHILGTIEDLLTKDPAVLEAWGALYGEVAAALQATEAGIYAKVEEKPGGWRGQREFVVARREMVSSCVARVTFEPVDGEPVCEFESGQYTTVWAKPEGWEFGQPRHYTLAFDSETEKGGYSISVRKQGQMSDFLHSADIGTKVKLSPPYGCFTLSPNVWLTDSTTPIVFLSAGVGITPTLAMLEAAEETTAPITWLYANKSGEEHAYRGSLMKLAAHRGNLTRRVWYTDPVEADGAADPIDNASKFHYKGLMDLSKVHDLLHLENPDTVYYFCGPPEWMDMVRVELEGLGVPKERVFFEGF